MNLEEVVLNEINAYKKEYGLENGLYDKSLKSLEKLDDFTRREIIIKLVKQKRITIKPLSTNNDPSFPLLIIDCN